MVFDSVITKNEIKEMSEEQKQSFYALVIKDLGFIKRNDGVKLTDIVEYAVKGRVDYTKTNNDYLSVLRESVSITLMYRGKLKKYNISFDYRVPKKEVA